MLDRREDTAEQAAQLVGALPTVPRFALAAMSLPPSRQAALAQQWEEAAAALPPGSTAATLVESSRLKYGL